MKKMLSILVIMALAIGVFPVALSEEFEIVEEGAIEETMEIVDEKEIEEAIIEETAEEEAAEEAAGEEAAEEVATEKTAVEEAAEEATKETAVEEATEEDETEPTEVESFEDAPEEEIEEVLLVTEEEKIYEGEVEIVIFNENEIEKIGDEVILQAVVKGIECDYKIQWQRYELEEDGYVWNPIPGETDKFYRYVLTEESINDLLRVEITIDD